MMSKFRVRANNRPLQLEWWIGEFLWWKNFRALFPSQNLTGTEVVVGLPQEYESALVQDQER